MDERFNLIEVASTSRYVARNALRATLRPSPWGARVLCYRRAVPADPRDNDITDATSTDPSLSGRAPRRAVPGIAVVLACDTPAAGGTIFELGGLDMITLGRENRASRSRPPAPEPAWLERTGPGRARIHLCDSKASRDHAEIRRVDGRFEVHDLGSTNGTFVDEAAIHSAPLAAASFLRVGHTFLRLVDDAQPIAARALPTSWPFKTLSGSFATSLDRLEKVATSVLPVLLSGETGTGKERVARAIHERSRRPGTFVAVNCGAIPTHLVESHLFGHKKGAFSGALTEEPGFVRTAHHGTLFLDEIGDLPLSAQGALLRVLQEGEVIPVGAAQPLKVDFRALAATHRPLEEMVANGTFREDLLARLAVFRFHLPPLRDRVDDVGLLVASAMRKSATGGAAARFRLTTDAGYALLRHRWPRNVRELFHVVNVAEVLVGDGVVSVSDLQLGAGGGGDSAPQPAGAPPAAAAAARPLSPEDEALRAELVQRFTERQGNIAAVARDMGKARQQVQRWKRRFGLGD